MHQVSERNLVSTYRLTQEVRTALSGSVVATHAGTTRCLNLRRRDRYRYVGELTDFAEHPTLLEAGSLWVYREVRT